MKHRSVFLASGLLVTLLALSSCGGGSSDGRVNLDITDSPTDDASSIVVEFTGIRAQPAVGAVVSYDFPQPVQLDLAQLQDGVSASLIQNLTLPGGHYQWLELEVSATPGAQDSSLTLNSGGVEGLVLTAAGKSGLRITGGFDVQANTGSSFIIDFNARRSVLPPVPPSTDYRLQPVLRMLDERAAGNIVGSVTSSLSAVSGCVPVVYVYAGALFKADDLNTGDTVSLQPVTEAAVQMDTTGAYHFTAAYLPAGTYTVAFTCDADQDDPTQADNIIFSHLGSVTVTAGSTTLIAL